MEGYTLLGIKLAMGIIGLVLQINLMGKGNLAPTSAMDQVQNYVLGGIIGGVIYSDSIGVLQFSGRLKKISVCRAAIWLLTWM